MKPGALSHYYLDLGLSPDQFCLGPEHPGLENLALEILGSFESHRVLEIGYQAGGFAVPLILELGNSRSFHYVGVDNLAYTNAVTGELVRSFLTEGHSLPEDRFEFHQTTAGKFLMKCEGQFDLILIDHLKKLYPRTLLLVFARQLLADDGAVLMHDVLDRAADPWRSCIRICSAFGYCWEIRDEVPGGVGVIRSHERPRMRKLLAPACGTVLRASYRMRSALRRSG